MLFFFIGCLTGSNFPNQFASVVCDSAYVCVNNQDIEAFFGYADVDECIFAQEEDFRISDIYTKWNNGESEFYPENASRCLSAFQDIQNSSECTGEMDSFYFFFDLSASIEECHDVYE